MGLASINKMQKCQLIALQYCRHHPIVLLHCIPRQAGSFGEGRELCDLRVEAHIVPQLALLFCQLFRRSDARKLLLEIFAFLVHLRNQRLELFLALLAGAGVDVAGMLRSVRPYGRIAPFKQVVIEFADAAGAWFPFLPHIGLEVHDAFLLRLRFFLWFCLADASVDAGGGCPLHIAGDVGVDVQRCHRGHMAQHGGEGFHIHSVLQRQRREGVPQIMESDTLAVCPLQYRLKPSACHTGRDRSVRLHRGRKHPAGIHLFAVFSQHGQHRRWQHQFSHGRLGFGRDDLQFAVYRVRLLVDGQHASFKVQILPLKRYQFTPPQAGAEIQQE